MIVNILVKKGNFTCKSCSQSIECWCIFTRNGQFVMGVLVEVAGDEGNGSVCWWWIAADGLLVARVLVGMLMGVLVVVLRLFGH